MEDLSHATHCMIMSLFGVILHGGFVTCYTLHGYVPVWCHLTWKICHMLHIAWLCPCLVSFDMEDLSHATHCMVMSLFGII